MTNENGLEFTNPTVAQQSEQVAHNGLVVGAIPTSGTNLEFNDWLIECIQGNRVLQSLLYDLNLLPECVKTPDQMFKMNTIVHHFIDFANDVERRAENGTVAQENGAAGSPTRAENAQVGVVASITDAQIQAALDVIDKFIQSRDAEIGFLPEKKAINMSEWISHFMHNVNYRLSFNDWMELDFVKDALQSCLSKTVENNTQTDLTTRDERQAALGELERLSSKYIEVNAALQSPRVPVIPGLDEAIEMSIWLDDPNQIETVPVNRRFQGYLKTLRNAARWVAELQKGV